MLVDNKNVHVTLTTSGENTIACKSLKEVFFNVYEVTINEHIELLKPLHRFVRDTPVVTANVTIDGTVFEDIEFKIVESDVSGIFLNQHTLANGGCIIEDADLKNKTSEEAADLIEEAVVELAEEQTFDAASAKQQAIDKKEHKIKKYLLELSEQLDATIKEELQSTKQTILAETLHAQNRLEQQSSKEISESIVVFKQKLESWSEQVETHLTSYTEEAIADAEMQLRKNIKQLLESNKQQTFEQLQQEISIATINSMAAIKDQLNEKITLQLNAFDEQHQQKNDGIQLFVAEQMHQLHEQVEASQMQKFDAKVADLLIKQHEWLQQNINEATATYDARVDALSDQVNKVIVEASANVTTCIKNADATIEEKIEAATLQLNEKVQQLHQERMQCIEQNVADVLRENLADEQPDVISEARASARNAVRGALTSYKADMNKELNAQLMNIQKELHNKLQIYIQSYAGGGSVAAQFADGGTMNGSLDVRGSILSGGRDLVDIFAGGGGGGYQTIEFNESSGFLTIAPFGNTVSLSALSGGDTHSNSVQWNSVYTTVNANSATTWNYQGTDIKSLTADWQNTTNSFNIQSPNNASVYTTVNANSAAWGVVGGGSDVSMISANWESTYTTVNSNSADWNYQGTDIKALTANWESTYTTLNANSANWSNVYATVQSNSSTWIAQTLTYNEAEAELTISNGNTISLSALNTNSVGVYLPLSGGTLTGDLDIQANITSVNSIQFDTTYTPGVGVTPGQIAWNSGESTLDLGLNADVTLQLGQETVIYVKNTSGEIIRNGWAVYASGASGTGSGHITISAYQANYGGVNDLYLIGVATQEISDNSFGFVTTIGKVRGVLKAEVQESTDLSSWSIGTMLYVSTTERGKFTSVVPSAPNEILPIAMIIGENGTHRTFFVRSNHGYKLTELHDVKIVSPQNGDLLSWDNTNNFWYNTTAYQGTDIKALTANWESTYTTVNSNSAEWANHVDLSLVATTSANWNSTYTTVNSNSATWEAGGSTIDTGVRAITGDWQSTYTTVNANSATAWNYQGTDVKSLTSNWQNTYTTVQDNSATWGAGGGGGGVPLASYSRWYLTGASGTTVYSIPGATMIASEAYRVTINSIIQDPAVYTIDASADTITFASIPPLSSDIIVIENKIIGGDITSLTANWEDTYTIVQSNSAIWTNDVYEEVWVGAGAMISPTLSGAESATLPVTGGGNGIYTDVFNFDAAAIEYAQFSFLPPTNCNRATFKCQFSWTASTTGSASWNIQAISLNDSNSIDIAWGNAQEAIDYATGATTFQITSATNTISPSGTTDSNSMMIFRAYRNVNSGDDTLAVDASLLGVRMQYMLNGGLSASW
jgi:hypothetical protein